MSVLDVSKAIIVAKDMEGVKYQVRIPTIDGIKDSKVSPTNDDNLSWASVVYTPGISVEYQVGDIVYVTFEDNELDEPLIIGYAKLRGKDIDSKVYLTAKTAVIEDSLTAPLDTTMGKSDYTEVFEMIDRCEHCPFYYRSGDFYTVNFWLHPPEYTLGEVPYATVYVPANNQSRIKTSDIPNDPPIERILNSQRGDGGEIEQYTLHWWYDLLGCAPTEDLPLTIAATGESVEVEFVALDGYRFVTNGPVIFNGEATVSYQFTDDGILVNISGPILSDLILIIRTEPLEDDTEPTGPTALADDTGSDTEDDEPGDEPGDGGDDGPDDEPEEEPASGVEGIPEETTFNGWYWKDPFGHYRLWDFNDNVYQNLDLFAMDYFNVAFQVKGRAYALRYVLADKFHRVSPPETPTDIELLPSNAGEIDEKSLTFPGWYYTDQFGNPTRWDFDKYILADATLSTLEYHSVKFNVVIMELDTEDEEPGPEEPDPENTVATLDDEDPDGGNPDSGGTNEGKEWTYTTKFVLADGLHPVTPPSQYPTGVGEDNFIGWRYKDTYGKYLPWDFNDYVSEDLTLYCVGHDVWIVSFVSFGETWAMQGVLNGDTCTDPGAPDLDVDHDLAYYTFLGWITEDGEEWDFGAPLTDNLTLYANWLDFKELRLLLDEAEVLDKDDYTETSWEAFDEALLAAALIWADAQEGACTQEQIDDALSDLQLAMQQLVPMG